ncbi:MAG: hypothetical protein IPL77_07050 [Flavobacteriales bacterium]|nr:hypothetical protein [Flavobacteriales bacterium]MBP6392070.1 hypothetical protein [Flavobacteriales bacterium]
MSLGTYRLTSSAIALAIAAVLHGQSEVPMLVVPKDDGLSMNGDIHHMWIGQANPITLSYAGSDELLFIETDNGTIEKGAFYNSKHAVTPRTPGPVNLRARARYYTGKTWDTTTVSATFEALAMPDIRVEVVGKPSYSDTVIHLQLVDRHTGAQMPRRYEVGRAYDVSMYNVEGKLTCELPYRMGANIQIRPFIWRCDATDRWHRMSLQLLVRDVSTGLLIPTDMLDYIFAEEK